MTAAIIIGVCIGTCAAVAALAWALTRGGSDDYEPIENGGDDE